MSLIYFTLHHGGIVTASRLTLVDTSKQIVSLYGLEKNNSSWFLESSLHNTVVLKLIINTTSATLDKMHKKLAKSLLINNNISSKSEKKTALIELISTTCKQIECKAFLFIGKTKYLFYCLTKPKP